MDSLSNLVHKKAAVRFCPRCKNKMAYTAVHGKYTCPNCNYTELDVYGQMKELLADNPSLSKIEMSMILDVPLRELNPFIKDGILENPYLDTK